MNYSNYQANKQFVARNFNASASTYDEVAVLQQTVLGQLVDRLDLVNINPELILELGSGTGTGARLLKKAYKDSNIVLTDLAFNMLNQSREVAPRFFSRQSYVCGDAELLPFKAASFDLVFSSLMLQWCHNLDQVFAEVKRILRPGGLFIFSSLGPDTLIELRESWKKIDELVHVNAFVDMHDVGDALLRMGLADPVMEVENFTLTYTELTTLMRELKQLGAQNVNAGRRHSLTGKGRLHRLALEYESWRTEGRLPASYEVIYGHAWNPVESKNKQVMENAVIPVSSIRRRRRG